MLVASLITLPIVYLACWRQAWGQSPFVPSIKTDWPSQYAASLNGRPVDQWDWKWLNRWCGQPEDGVSGVFALVWKDANTLVTYAEYTGYTGSRLAWSWNLRNKVQALKYRYAIPGVGPYKTFTLFGHTFGYGYKVINGLNVPVGSRMS